MFQPRSYQLELLQAMTAGQKKRGIAVWHRRAGKDITILNAVATLMRLRSGIYYYFLPTYAQAKKIVWDGIDYNGRPFLANFPSELIEDKHQTELKITYKTSAMLAGGAGSIFQLIGGDNIDSIVGTNPVVCVYSEYSIMNPRAWELTLPILQENGGSALFAFTPRGRNHGWKLWKAARSNPTEWFTSMKTVDDTRRDAPGEDGSYVVSPEQIEAARRSGMSEEMIQQEFYCSFEGAMVGAYYADQIALARAEGRIAKVPYNPMYPVDTAWDVGVDDATAIWFTQTISGQCRHIEYLEAAGHGLDWYARELRMRPYNYGRHYAPHDVAVREWSTGNTRLQIAGRREGLHFNPQPKLSLEDGIEATRSLIPISVYDAEKCAKGIDALSSYRREFDDKTQTWRTTPVHDWASHGSDAERIRAIAWRSDLGGTRTDWASTRFNIHDDVAGQEHAERSFVPNRNGRQDTHAEVEVERGDDWWR